MGKDKVGKHHKLPCPNNSHEYCSDSTTLTALLNIIQKIQQTGHGDTQL